MRYWLDKFDHGEIYQLIKNLKEKYNIQWTSYDLLDLLYPIAYIHDNKNAFDLLVEAQINDHGWDRHWTEKSKAVQRWSFLKDKFPGRYIEFFQKSTNNHVPLSRGVEFFLFFGDTENAALVLNSGINFAESLTADITLDAPTWINEKDIDDLALLLQRMVWPSPLIRERAINGIAKLLCTNHKKAETFQKIFTWLQLQKMESTVAIGLLPIIRAFDLQHSKKDLSYINLTTIINALPFSSVVVDKLIEELAALTGSSTLNTKERLSVTPYHENYSVDPFFEKYINTFLPPIYLNRAKKINPYKGKDFVKQWAFTAKEIAKEANVKFNANQCYYYSQYKGADLLRGFSSRISEVFRSAFLRVLHFYYINECVPTDFYLEYAYATLPIELSRWKIGTNRCPNWWPKFKIDPDHKTGKDEILQLQLEAPIQPSRILDNEKVLLAAEGAIKPSMGWENDPMHSFSLLSFGYKVLGNELPSPEEVIDAINYHSHLILIPSITKRPFHFLENKDIFLTTDTDEYLQIKDLIVYPILSREKDLAIGLWQYFRDFFDGLNLRPELTENLNLTLTKNSWVYRDKSGSIYAEHRDWIEGLKERYDHDLPIPYGNFLTIDKGHIQSWAQQNNLRIGYVLRIVNRFKEYSYADVKEFKNTEFIDVSSIITP